MPSHSQAKPSQAIATPLGRANGAGGGFDAPDVEECRVQAEVLGMPPEEGDKFWEHYEAVGWIVGGSGLKCSNWIALMGKWRTRWRSEQKALGGAPSAHSAKNGTLASHYARLEAEFEEREGKVG